MTNKFRKQRHTALRLSIEYIMGIEQQKVCDFLNSGKLDINNGFLWQKEENSKINQQTKKENNSIQKSLVAMEFGFKQHEKGHNLEKAREELLKHFN